MTECILFVDIDDDGEKKSYALVDDRVDGLVLAEIEAVRQNPMAFSPVIIDEDDVCLYEDTIKAKMEALGVEYNIRVEEIEE